MYELLSQNQMYIVLIVALLVWTGVLIYLIRLDKKIKLLESRLKKD